MPRAMTERHVIELINRYGANSGYAEAVKLAAGNYNVRGISNPLSGKPYCQTSELFKLTRNTDNILKWHMGQCSDFFGSDFVYETFGKEEKTKYVKTLKIYDNNIVVTDKKTNYTEFLVGAAFSGVVSPKLYGGPSHYVISGKVIERADGRKMVCFMTEGGVDITTTDGALGYIGAVNDYNKCLHYLPSTVPEKELLGKTYDFPFLNEREPSWLSPKVRAAVDELNEIKEGQAVGVAWRSPDRPDEPVISPSRLLTYYIPGVEGEKNISFMFCLEQRVIMDTYAIPETRGVVTVNVDGSPKSYQIGTPN